MGLLTLPPAGSIYADANVFIYTVERVAPYFMLLDDFWKDVRAAQRQVLTSELTLLEVLPKPFRLADPILEQIFRDVLERSPDVSLMPITMPIIEQAARLRATTSLKTPDAIHAATALLENCALFVTNDPAFRRVPGLTVVILSDLVTPPASP